MLVTEDLVVPKAAQVLAQALKADILSGRVRTGQPMPPPDEISRRFGVSRPTVREALNLLESQGLVRLKRGPKGGAIVQPPNRRAVTRALGDLLEYERISLDQLMEARSILEPAAARLAADRASPEALRSLEETIVRMENDVEDMRTWLDENLLFHASIATASGNLVLGALMESLTDIITRGAMAADMTVEDRTASIREHRAILAALRGGDGDLAESLMFDHIHFSIFARRRMVRADGRGAPAGGRPGKRPAPTSPPAP